MLAAEEWNDSERRRRAAAGGGGGSGGTATAGSGQRQGQVQGGDEAIPIENMVPDGDGGWVEPPPPYVADPKPAYHP